MALSQPPGAFPPAISPQQKKSSPPIVVVGLPSHDSLPEADLYVGALRYLEMVPSGKAVLPVGSSGASLAVALDRTAEMISSGRRVCVLVQGDPGFFGVGRVFADRFGPAAWRYARRRRLSASLLPVSGCPGTTPLSSQPRAATPLTPSWSLTGPAQAVTRWPS